MISNTVKINNYTDKLYGNIPILNMPYNNLIKLGTKIGHGSYGKVFNVDNNESIVCKIFYNSKSNEKLNYFYSFNDYYKLLQKENLDYLYSEEFIKFIDGNDNLLWPVINLTTNQMIQKYGFLNSQIISLTTPYIPMDYNLSHNELKNLLKFFNEYLIHSNIYNYCFNNNLKVFNHICKIEDVFITRNKLINKGFMILKKYKYTLHDWILENKTSKNFEKILLGILIQIIFIINTLEDNLNFIFRDLKPSNLLIDSFNDSNERYFTIDNTTYFVPEGPKIILADFSLSYVSTKNNTNQNNFHLDGLTIGLKPQKGIDIFIFTMFLQYIYIINDSYNVKLPNSIKRIIISLLDSFKDNAKINYLIKSKEIFYYKTMDILLKKIKINTKPWLLKEFDFLKI